MMKKLAALWLAAVLLCLTVISAAALSEGSQTDAEQVFDDIEDASEFEDGIAEDNDEIPDVMPDEGSLEFLDIDPDEPESSPPETPDGVEFVIEDGVLKAYGGKSSAVVIPETVKEIANGVFENNKTICDITIPSGLKRVGFNAFYNCKNLTTVRIDDLDAWMELECDGPQACPNLYATDVYVAGKLITELEVPTVKSIRAYAFNGFGNLTRVTIPETVESIGECAFCKCKQLKYLTLPESLKELGAGCFYECFRLSTVKIPSTITKIPLSAFMFCYNMTAVELPEGLTEIGEQAFAECWKLKNMPLPSTLRTIGAAAFYSGTGMDKGYPSRMVNVTVPEGVESIGDLAFAYCQGLESIVFPDSLEEIGAGAFLMCSGLKSVSIPALNYLGESAFEACSALENCEIRGSIDEVGDLVFLECSSLKRAEICEGINEISYGMFEGCGALSCLYLPKSLMRVSDSAFAYCEALAGPDGLVYYAGSGEQSTYILIGRGNEALTSNPWICDDVRIHAVSCAETLVLGVGETCTLEVTPEPADGVGTITFASSAPKKVAVNANTGVLKGKSSGTARITVFVDGFAMAYCDVKAKKAASKIAVKPGSLTMGVGETYALTSVITGTSNFVGWSSSNDASVYVEDGVLSAIAEGTSKIRAKTFNGKTGVCKVTVRSAPDAVSLDEHVLKLAQGDRFSLHAALNEGAGGKITYVSSDPMAASVDPDTGLITAVAPGTAVITANAYNGVSDTCMVDVKGRIEEVCIAEPDGLILGKGEKISLSVSTLPDDGLNTAFQFTTSNKHIASVTSGGVVKAKHSGTVKIRVKAYNGVTKIIKLRIKDAPSRVKISLPETVMRIGETQSYQVTYNKGAGGRYTVTSDSDNVRMNGDGTITALREGTSVLTVKALANNKKASVKVTVLGLTE